MRPIAAMFLLLAPLPAQEPAQLAATQADREILLPRQPALSPDGSQVAFSWRGDVWVAATTGGQARRVTTYPGDDDAPVFHPDGRQIAFTSDRAGRDQIFLMTLPSGDSAGSAPRQLTFDSNSKQLLGFADGGATMVLSIATDRHFHRTESSRLYLAPTDGGGSKRMLLDAGFAQAALSPDGTKVLLARGRESWWRKGYVGASAYQLWLADLSQLPPRLSRLSKDRPGYQNVSEHSPMWTPDGKGYWFVSDPDGTFDVYHRALGDDATQRVTNVAAEDGSDDGVAFPAVSADGAVMVVRRLFHLLRVDPKTLATARIDLAAAGDQLAFVDERREEKRAETVAFTPDGKQMAFVAGDDVYVMDRVLREPVRVTTTPSQESDLLFSKDGKTLWFVSDAAGEMDVWSVACPRQDGVWWLAGADPAEQFAPQQVTDDREVEARLTLSPDGERLGLLRDNQLFVMQLDGKGQQRVAETWSRPDYAWSPDGKWMIYATQDDDYNNDVWLAAVDGSRKPFNLSRHPGPEGDPVWSPDGKRVAFVGQRDGEESDIYYVNLSKDDEEKTGRDRKLEEALAAMKKGGDKKKPGGRPQAPGGDAPAGKDGDAPVAAADDKPADDAGAKPTEQAEEKPAALPAVVIDFDGILDRIHRIAIADSRESGLVWSPDGKKLLFDATVDNQRGVYQVEFPEVEKPKLVAKSGLSQAVFLVDGKELVGLASSATPGGSGVAGRFFFGGGGGVPAAMTVSSGKIEKFEFVARQVRDWSALRQLAFDQAWRAMRDRFYDPVLNHRDWDAVRAKYRPVAARCLGSREFNDLVNLMLGELNASHMGHSGGDEPLPRASNRPAWSATTYHLGLRFPGATGQGRLVEQGLRVESVIPGSPCDQARSRVEVGETVLAIDGRALDGTVDVDALLTMDEEREVSLRVRTAAGVEREVKVRPVASVAGLLYEEWVENTRRQVEALSAGRLGYLHIRGMDMRSVRQMEEDLFAAGHDKDGLIVDVRYNGGGSTADHVLTILTQPVHAITQSRGSGLGYPVDRKVYASWSKPIVLMCNEFSFSNAEILSHAVKQLGRGRTVGMRTGGGVISTGSVSLADGSRVRMPMRGWYLASNGEDMELNGCLPDIALWNPPTGDDVQLQKAVQALTEDVAAELARGRPEPRPASSRREPAAAVEAQPAGTGGVR